MKILFIGHDASRTGAPILLLNFLKWLKQNSNINFDVLLINGGDLEKEYEKITKVHYWQPPQLPALGLKRQIINKIFNIEYNSKKQHYTNLFTQFAKNNYTVIYGNTVVASAVIPDLLDYLPKAKVILHVHELADITLKFNKKIENAIYANAKFITVSEITRKNLINNHKISASAISLIYAFIDVQEVLKNTQPKSNNQFTVHGSGLVQIRKGYDTFISVAKRAVQKYPEIPFHFKWIGALPNNLEYYINNDIKQAGLTSVVSFVGAIDQPFAEYSKASVFIMTSRQDPFPLVCLEHAVLGKPIICFDKGTGIPEFVENDAGIVVPYLDIEAMVDALYLLYSNEEMRNKFGKTASIKALHFDIDIQAKKILDIIND